MNNHSFTGIALSAASEKQTVSGKPEVDIRYRSDRFTSRVVGLKFHLRSDIFATPAQVRIEAYDGKGAKANLVGEAADCEARDEKTREVTLQPTFRTRITENWGFQFHFAKLKDKLLI